MICLMCWWILFASILLRIFATVFISAISFFVISLFGFGFRVVASQDKLGSVLSSELFWKSLRRVDICSSLNV